MVESNGDGVDRPPMATEVEMQEVPDTPETRALEREFAAACEGPEVGILLGVLRRCADTLFPDE